MNDDNELKSYPVWDAPTRWFHWINALSVIALAGAGLVILNDDALGLSNPGKFALKKLHVWVGYVFVLNLCFRIAWAFAGNRYARWRQVLPGGPGYLHSVRSYVSAFVAGKPQRYLGHNPLGRLAVAAMFALIVVQASTGLVLAGTDIFYPPFGHWFAHSIAAPGVAPSTVVPYAPELYDKPKYESMRAMRKPFVEVHEVTFYLLLIAAALHIAAVVVTELREGGNLISAMFTGRKIVSGKPMDE